MSASNGPLMASRDVRHCSHRSLLPAQHHTPSKPIMKQHVMSLDLRESFNMQGAGEMLKMQCIAEAPHSPGASCTIPPHSRTLCPCYHPTCCVRLPGSASPLTWHLDADPLQGPQGQCASRAGSAHGSAKCPGAPARTSPRSCQDGTRRGSCFFGGTLFHMGLQSMQIWKALCECHPPAIRARKTRAGCTSSAGKLPSIRCLNPCQW